MIATPRAPALAVALAVAACGGDRPDHGASMSVDTVDGVVHVRNVAGPPSALPAPALVLGEAGGFDDASPTEFARIRSVMADGDGRLYVADGTALEIRVFDADGRHLRTLGRKGGGPGELEGLHGAVWLGDDRLVAADFGNARLALLDVDGTQHAQWPWMRITGNVPFIHSVGRDEFYAHAFRRTSDAAGRPLVEAAWTRFRGDGPLDTVAIPRLDEPLPGTAARCEGDGIGFFDNPHGERLVAAPAPGGQRAVAMSSAYRIAFIDAAGDTVRVLTRDADPVPLPDDEWEQTRQRYDEWRGLWRGASCTGDIRRPRNRPLLLGAAFDHLSRLVVEFNTPAGPAIDLYDHDFRWLATLPLPDRDRSVPLHLRDDRLYLVTRDDLGVQRIEAYHLPVPSLANH